MPSQAGQGTWPDQEKGDVWFTLVVGVKDYDMEVARGAPCRLTKGRSVAIQEDNSMKKVAIHK